MSNLLVTGGAGFIGSNFVHYWLKNHPQDKIVNIDKLTYAGNLENLATIANHPNYLFMQLDILDQKKIEVLLTEQKIDTIVHFAAETHVDRSINDPLPFVKTNIEGTYSLLEAARKKNLKRFHHISTDEVFGALPLNSKVVFTHQTAYAPRSPYAASKAASDHLVRAYHTTYGLPITISNCSNNFGPYQFPEKLFGLAITNLLEGKKIPVYGDGLYVRDWLYVEDHCRAIDLILNKGKIGDTYLVGGLTEDIANIDVIKTILRLMNKDESSIEYIEDRPGHDRRYAIDWSKIKNELGWSPQYNFEQALQKTISWYQTNEAWWQRVKSGDYQAYYRQQYLKK